MCPINTNSPGAPPAGVTPPSSGASSANAAVDSTTGSAPILATPLAPSRSASIDGPQGVDQVTAVASIPESFPIGDLSQLKAEGLQGQTFLLDAGSLRGLKLQVRRISDGGEPGFEILFRVTDAKIEPLEKRLLDKGAERNAVEFRGAAENADGVCEYTTDRAVISKSGTHAPTDIGEDAKKWALSLEGAKGGAIELVCDEAAVAIRGLVRLDLRGSDAECTKQLDGLIKNLGLGFLFAPPTPKSKRTNMLMRVLFQHDHEKATELSKKDLSKLKTKDVEKALVDAGFSMERIDGLRYEEVFDGHFTVIDPQQAEEMAKAGARYLYSTVRNPEHVHSILLTGQKSSMQRYFEGAIINGMSTNSDFITGGAVGVFTRVVTQDSIYSEKKWTGRAYKLIQNHEQLARTDWYGWNGDKFGRRWELSSDENFGPSLVEKIDSNGYYKATNEIIFTAGNRPENIERVVATSEKDRATLIDLLKKENYQPHNGLTVEEFVVNEPSFFVFGPSSYECDDPKAFAKEALEEAEAAQLGKLKWFLIEGPESEERGAFETRLVTHENKEIRDAHMFSLKRTGRFAMTEPQLKVVLDKLTSSDEQADKDILKEFVRSGAQALLRANNDQALDVLKTHNKINSNHQMHAMTYDEWGEAIADLVSQQTSSDWSNSLAYALESRAARLIERKDDQFLSLLKENPLVKMPQTAAWIKKEIKQAIDKKAPSLEFSLYLAQISQTDKAGPLQKKLLAADNADTMKLLELTMAISDGIQLSGQELADALNDLPDDSKIKAPFLKKFAKDILKLGDPKLIDVFEDNGLGQKDFNLGYGATRELGVHLLQDLDNISIDFFRRFGERCGKTLGPSTEFRTGLSECPDLYDFSEGWPFAEKAIQSLSNDEGGHFKLMAMIASPNVNDDLKQKTLLQLLTSDESEATKLAADLIQTDSDGKIPFSSDILHRLLADLHPDNPNAVTKILKSSGRALLVSAAPDTISELEKHLQEDKSLNHLFGVSGDTLVSVIKEIGEQGGPNAQEVQEWLIKASLSEALIENNTGFIDYLKVGKLTRESCGQDIDWAVQTFKEAVETSKNKYTGWSANSNPTLDEAAMWLLTGNTSTYDEAVLQGIKAKIKSWKWNADLLDAVLERCSGLSDAWKKKLKKAAK